MITASTPEAGTTAPPSGPNRTLDPDGKPAPTGTPTSTRTADPGFLDHGKAVVYGTDGTATAGTAATCSPGAPRPAGQIRWPARSGRCPCASERVLRRLASVGHRTARWAGHGHRRRAASPRPGCAPRAPGRVLSYPGPTVLTDRQEVHFGSRSRSYM